jgi:phytoene/squalene synthetase
MPSARGRAAFRFAADAYGAILDKIRQNGHDVITRRASLSFTEKLAMIPVSTWHAWRVGIVRSSDAPAGAERGP